MSAPSASSSARLAQRLARVGRVHLVAGAVAELGRAVGGLAERAVEAARVLHRVAQDRRRLEPLAVERARGCAPTRPSIMSLGATTSAPACACTTAIFASTSSVASLSTSTRRRAACAGCRSGRGRCTRRRTRRSSRRAPARRPSSRRRRAARGRRDRRPLDAAGVLVAGQTEEDDGASQAAARTASRAASAAARHRELRARRASCARGAGASIAALKNSG